MKSFEWTNPATINEAVKMLNVASSGDIDEAPRPIAGGQDLLTTMKDYTSRPVRLVNLKNIPGLNQHHAERPRTNDRRACYVDRTRRARRRAQEFSRACRSCALDRHAANPQSRHGRRQPLPAPALLVLPPRRIDLSEEGRLGVLRSDRREQVQRDLRRWSIVHRSSVRSRADAGGARRHSRPSPAPRANA